MSIIQSNLVVVPEWPCSLQPFSFDWGGGGVVSKETGIQRRWGVGTNIWFYHNRVDKFGHHNETRELTFSALALETSTLVSLYSG